MSDLQEILHAEDLIHLRKQIFQSGKRPERGPFYSEIHLTNRCNARCYFCNQRTSRCAPVGELKREILFVLLQSLADSGLRAVRFSGGGDPTVYGLLYQALELMKELGIQLFRFDTNGRNLTPRLMRCMMKTDLRILHISLQAPTAESWAEVTGFNPADFECVMDNIEQCLRMCHRLGTLTVYISFVVDTPTVKHLPEMFILARKLGVCLDIHDLNNHVYSQDFYQYSLPQLMEYMTDLSSEDLQAFSFSVLHDPASFLMKNHPGRMRQPMNDSACVAPWAAILIKANGDIFPCCNLQKIPSMVMGNINSHDILDIWQGKTYNSFRKKARRIFFSSAYSESPLDSNNKLNGVCNSDCQVKHGLFGINTIY